MDWQTAADTAFALAVLVSLWSICGSLREIAQSLQAIRSLEEEAHRQAVEDDEDEDEDEDDGSEEALPAPPSNKEGGGPHG